MMDMSYQDMLNITFFNILQSSFIAATIVNYNIYPLQKLVNNFYIEI